MNIKRDDTVQVITGKDKGKKGKVREVHPSSNAVIVEGLNIVKKHTKGSAGARQAGVIEQEAALNASKVMVICPNCNKPRTHWSHNRGRWPEGARMPQLRRDIRRRFLTVEVGRTPLV